MKKNKIVDINGVKPEDISLNAGTLYDMNKQLVEQTCKPLTQPEIAGLHKKIYEWVKSNSQIKYLMLLCNDIKYFTLFNLDSHDVASIKAASEILGCLEDNGKLYDMELNEEDNAWECWVKQGEELLAFYLFDYTNGIIDCREGVTK